MTTRSLVAASHGRLLDVEVRAEAVELCLEVLVAAVDELDAGDPGGALGGQGGDQVAEAAAQVGDVDVGAVQLGRARR